MFTNKNISLCLHAIAFLAGNSAIVAFVPQHYQELVGILANAAIGLSAFFDRTHADEVAGR